MALEHQHPSPFGRKAFPHAERGTKVLNDFTVLQAQAMFDFVRIVGPPSVRDARPYLEDALAIVCEAARPRLPDPLPANPRRGRTRCPGNSGKTSRGSGIHHPLSATGTQLIEAGSEEEALKMAKQPSPPARP